MNEKELAEFLVALFESDQMSEFLDEYLDDNIDLAFDRASTFDDDGVLTRNKGVILRWIEGDDKIVEFQLTIVRSR